MVGDDESAALREAAEEKEENSEENQSNKKEHSKDQEEEDKERREEELELDGEELDDFLVSPRNIRCKIEFEDDEGSSYSDDFELSQQISLHFDDWLITRSNDSSAVIRKHAVRYAIDDNWCANRTTLWSRIEKNYCTV